MAVLLDWVVSENEFAKLAKIIKGLFYIYIVVD